MDVMAFDSNCKRCPRLSAFLRQVRQDYPNYYAKPVPAFGVERPRLLIVGLAPGMHGANASGRPFTGDFAGILLYETLHKFGFSNRPVSESASDGLKLKRCRITNAVKCLPPNNKPIGSEINTCNDYLREELAALPKQALVICLGSVAHQSVIKALDLRAKDFPFGHAHLHQCENGLRILDSYHCSRYNTQTKRLSTPMFESIFATATELLGNA
jgi:uracil-DNA glycosylase family 4